LNSRSRAPADRPRVLAQDHRAFLPRSRRPVSHSAECGISYVRARLKATPLAANGPRSGIARFAPMSGGSLAVLSRLDRDQQGRCGQEGITIVLGGGWSVMPPTSVPGSDWGVPWWPSGRRRPVPGGYRASGAGHRQGDPVPRSAPVRSRCGRPVTRCASREAGTPRHARVPSSTAVGRLMSEGSAECGARVVGRISWTQLDAIRDIARRRDLPWRVLAPTTAHNQRSRTRARTQGFTSGPLPNHRHTRTDRSPPRG
jgi:hypothetical protein